MSNLTNDGEKTMQLAQTAYEAYSAYTGGRSAVTGDKLPDWLNLPGGVKNAWFAAVSAVRLRIEARP